MTTNTVNKLEERLSEAWYKALEAEFTSDYMLKLKAFLTKEFKEHTIYPSSDNTFNAFKLCPLDQVKVVILGQDPYHGPNQAHGLCFSVQEGIKPPPSLVNIFKELKQDLGINTDRNAVIGLSGQVSGDLSGWAKQGVFLLNTSLSVRAHEAGSHFNQGWEIFTDKVIRIISEETKHVVFMLWGSPARAKKSLIDSSKHLILEAPHPSPLSAHRGFLGCKHFSQANEYLKAHGLEEINWDISC